MSNFGNFSIEFQTKLTFETDRKFTFPESEMITEGISYYYIRYFKEYLQIERTEESFKRIATIYFVIDRARREGVELLEVSNSEDNFGVEVTLKFESLQKMEDFLSTLESIIQKQVEVTTAKKFEKDIA